VIALLDSGPLGPGSVIKRARAIFRNARSFQAHSTIILAFGVWGAGRRGPGPSVLCGGEPTPRAVSDPTSCADRSVLFRSVRGPWPRRPVRSRESWVPRDAMAPRQPAMMCRATRLPETRLSPSSFAFPSVRPINRLLNHEINARPGTRGRASPLPRAPGRRAFQTLANHHNPVSQNEPMPTPSPFRKTNPFQPRDPVSQNEPNPPLGSRPGPRMQNEPNTPQPWRALPADGLPPPKEQARSAPSPRHPQSVCKPR
jgi:hypothetical protein